MAELTESIPEPTVNSDINTPAGASEFGSDATLGMLRDGVMYLLRRELRDSALADDLCNETFRIVLERLRQQPLEDPAGLSSYLGQTARNLVIAHRRKISRQRTETGHQATLDSTAATDADPALMLQSRSRATAIRKVLKEIPLVRDREILVRVYLYDQDKEKVCRELGIGSAHFNLVIHRAKERFRTLIEQRYARSDLYSFAFI